MSRKYIYKYIVAAWIVISCCATAHSQQTQPYTQYLFDRYLLNPAACGSNGFSTVGLTVKDQWVGFSGAPFNQVLTGQTRLSREGLFGSHSTKRKVGGYSPENVGLGIMLFNDVRGPIRTTGGQFTYAYHAPTNPGQQLSFGLSINLFQLSLNRNKMTTEYEDTYLNTSNLKGWVPDATFGIHYAAHKYYAGASVSNLFQSFLMLGGRNSSGYRIERQYNLLGGYIIDFDEDWSFVPTVQVKMTQSSVVQADFNTTLYYYDQFWGGLSYRTGGGGVPGSASAMVGVRYKQYHFGYAFDYQLSSIRRYSHGSHELMLTITFGQNERFFRFLRRYEYKIDPEEGRSLDGNIWRF
jgi:type IX secretion system PorP/SprF family membrane protein